MLDSLRRLFGLPLVASPSTSPTLPPPEPEPDPDDTTVPELPIAALRALLEEQAALTVLDVREQYEWDQVHLPTTPGWPVLHIPMNTLPARLDELPHQGEIAVLCAHGNRSYGVTHYLLTQGFRARNVTGGITRWTIEGGEIERG